MIQIDGVKVVMNSEYEIALRQEILEKVLFLLSCVKGTIPYNREIGLDPDIISVPPYIAQNLYTVSAIDLIEQFEPRASVEEIIFEIAADSGNFYPKVVLTYNGE